MTSVYQFVLDRVAEDEQWAGPPPSDEARQAADRSANYDEAAWIFWQDRVRAECAAKRRIIGPLVLDGDVLDWEDETTGEAEARRQAEHRAAYFTACHLAAVYRDHPDFRPEWLHPGRRP